jgi:hypothetical protein
MTKQYISLIDSIIVLWNGRVVQQVVTLLQEEMVKEIELIS